MQPDLPEPVVPAISRCGIRARSVQTALPEMSLPSQTDERARLAGHVVEDVAERDELRREVRHLDADRLLAGDRRQDADLGRRERVGEVVLQPRDLRDLRARRELQLVAHDARAGDLADDRCASTPKCESVSTSSCGDARARVAVVAASPAGDAFRSAAVGQAVLARRARRSKSIASCVLRRRRRRSRCSLDLGDERRRLERTRLGRASDHVGVALDRVDRRARGAGCGRRAPRASSAVVVPVRGRRAVERAPGRAAGAVRTAWPERRSSAPADAPVKSSVPATKQRHADDQRAGLADDVREAAAERAADRAALVAPEGDHAGRTPPTARPVRNGFRSTSSLRTSISAPTPTRTSGSR